MVWVYNPVLAGRFPILATGSLSLIIVWASGSYVAGLDGRHEPPYWRLILLQRPHLAELDVSTASYRLLAGIPLRIVWSGSSHHVSSTFFIQYNITTYSLANSRRTNLLSGSLSWWHPNLMPWLMKTFGALMGGFWSVQIVLAIK